MWYIQSIQFEKKSVNDLVDYDCTVCKLGINNNNSNNKLIKIKN